jgi:hypothetical protein
LRVTIHIDHKKEVNMKQHRAWMYLVIAVVAMMLSACGGGGGGDTAANGSNWDEMKWDQGQWK